jgi:hypothetical protein
VQGCVRIRCGTFGIGSFTPLSVSACHFLSMVEKNRDGSNSRRQMMAFLPLSSHRRKRIALALACGFLGGAAKAAGNIFLEWLVSRI